MYGTVLGKNISGLIIFRTHQCCLPCGIYIIYVIYLLQYINIVYHNLIGTIHVMLCCVKPVRKYTIYGILKKVFVIPTLKLSFFYHIMTILQTPLRKQNNFLLMEIGNALWKSVTLKTVILVQIDFFGF